MCYSISESEAFKHFLWLHLWLSNKTAQLQLSLASKAVGAAAASGQASFLCSENLGEYLGSPKVSEHVQLPYHLQFTHKKILEFHQWNGQRAGSAMVSPG